MAQPVPPAAAAAAPAAPAAAAPAVAPNAINGRPVQAEPSLARKLLDPRQVVKEYFKDMKEFGQVFVDNKDFFIGDYKYAGTDATPTHYRVGLTAANVTLQAAKDIVGTVALTLVAVGKAIGRTLISPGAWVAVIGLPFALVAGALYLVKLLIVDLIIKNIFGISSLERRVENLEHGQAVFAGMLQRQNPELYAEALNQVAADLEMQPAELQRRLEMRRQAPAEQPVEVQAAPVEVAPAPVQLGADQARAQIANGLALARANFEGLNDEQRQAGINAMREIIAQSADAAASDAALAADVAALAALLPAQAAPEAPAADAPAGEVPAAPPMAPRALDVVVADVAAQVQASAPLAAAMAQYGQPGQPAAPAADVAALVQAQVDANAALIAEARAVNAPADQIEQLEAVNRQLRREPAPAPAPIDADVGGAAGIPDAPAM